MNIDLIKDFEYEYWQVRIEEGQVRIEEIFRAGF
jgi:hypothetical protein